MRRRIRYAAEVALCGLCLLSFMMLSSIAVRFLRTRRLNGELSARRAQQSALVSASPEMQIEIAESPSPVQKTMAAPAVVQTVSPAVSPTVRAAAFHRVGGTPLPGMESLYNENHDLIGWLEIPEVIDLPVMYRDNMYYLTHDFDGKKNAAGAIFLDKNHRFSERTQNLLLHGHNMKDGTMFGRLTQYAQDIDYYRQHAFVNYDTLWEKEQYVIFAVLRVSLDVKDESFIDYYAHPTFRSEREFAAYVRELQLRSMYAIPLSVEPSDALLTLSTCMEEDRLVIVCRRLREGESKAALRPWVRLAQRQ